MTEPTAVLLMAYGTPCQESDIKGYYTNIRHGQAPPKPLMDQLVGRYKAIGLPSPLTRITTAQRDGLQAALDKAHPCAYKVYEGLKYIAPFIKDAVDQIAADGITKIIGLPLAPQYSSYSSVDYHNRARKAVEAHPGIGIPAGAVLVEPPRDGPLLERSAGGQERSDRPTGHQGDLQRPLPAPAHHPGRGPQQG